jgi:hypothetical protein
MDVTKALITLLKEANIYQSQGLLTDARRKYETATALLNEHVELKNRDELLARVDRKMAALEQAVYRVEKRRVTPEISLTDKDLIKRLFSVSASHDPDDAAIEGALALAKFGLFDHAIREFELLIENSKRRLEVAKHILRCRMAIRAMHDPMAQYNKWTNSTFFSDKELQKLKVFLERTEAAGSSVTSAPAQSVPQSASVLLPKAPEPKPQAPPPPPPTYDPYEDSYEDVLSVIPQKPIGTIAAGGSAALEDEDYEDSVIDKLVIDKAPKKKSYEESPIEDYIDYLSSVSIPVSVGPRKGQMVDVRVNLQTADTVNIIVAAADKDLIALLKQGARIEKMKLNSPISNSVGNGVVVAGALINQGPRQGDYSVDLKIQS